MKLIVGKEEIEKFKESGEEFCWVAVTYRGEDGEVYPALVVFELSDFSEVMFPE